MRMTKTRKKEVSSKSSRLLVPSKTMQVPVRFREKPSSSVSRFGGQKDERWILALSRLGKRHLDFIERLMMVEFVSGVSRTAGIPGINLELVSGQLARLNEQPELAAL